MSEAISVTANIDDKVLIITCDGEGYEMDKETAADFLCAVLDACEVLGIVEPVSPRIH